MSSTTPRRPCICGPSAKLPIDLRDTVNEFYSKLADICEQVLGARAHMKHEGRRTNVDERERILKYTSLLVVVAIAEDYDTGILVEMADRYLVPVVILCEQSALETSRISERISPLLLGNPAVRGVIAYKSFDEALKLFTDWLKTNRSEIS